jgi:AcrR family transcriptional regulator
MFRMNRTKSTLPAAGSARPDGGNGALGGLRSRQKARRHDEILEQARALFAEKGVDTTTMAEIAEAAGVSTPTVFNYFGNKDSILIALITESAQKARDNNKVLEPRTDVDFLTTLMTVFMDISIETMKIADKRIWRYANAATIRHPGTDFAQSFEEVDSERLAIICQILSQYDLTLHDRSSADPRQIAHLFFDVWLMTFQNFIRSEEMALSAHEAQLRARFAPLCQMLFAPDFLAAPRLVADRG